MESNQSPNIQENDSSKSVSNSSKVADKNAESSETSTSKPASESTKAGGIRIAPNNLNYIYNTSASNPYGNIPLLNQLTSSGYDISKLSKLPPAAAARILSQYSANNRPILAKTNSFTNIAIRPNPTTVSQHLQPNKPQSAVSSPKNKPKVKKEKVAQSPSKTSNNKNSKTDTGFKAFLDGLPVEQAQKLTELFTLLVNGTIQSDGFGQAASALLGNKYPLLTQIMKEKIQDSTNSIKNNSNSTSRNTSNLSANNQSNLSSSSKGSNLTNKPQPQNTRTLSNVGPSKTLNNTNINSKREEESKANKELKQSIGIMNINLKEERGAKNNLNTKTSNNNVLQQNQYSNLLPIPTPFIDQIPVLQRKIQKIGSEYDINEVDPKVFELISKAAEARVQTIIGNMVKASHHRVRTNQSLPPPPINSEGKPEYKININLDSKRHIIALERIDREEERQFKVNIEQGLLLEEENDPKSKRSKIRKEANAFNPKNLSESDRKLLANQTTHFMTGVNRKSWMTNPSLSPSNSPRISSPLASTPPINPLKQQHKPNVSSNLVPKNINNNENEDKPNLPTTINNINNNRNNIITNPIHRKLPIRYLTLQDALFVVEEENLDHPHHSNLKFLVEKYSKLK